MEHLFPWLDPKEIQHQTKFRIALGHVVVDIDGRARETLDGRSDILVSRAGRPLAVLELKRPNLKLTAKDDEQGLSYARLFQDRPPIVAVSNGDETRILGSHDGLLLHTDSVSEQQLEALISSAAKVAANSTKNAIEVLLGPESDVWAAAVRRTTATTIAELSGTWADRLRPFVTDFLIPRKASRQIYEHLRSRTQAVVVEGPPLVGKSNVLRELTLLADQCSGMAILFIESGSSGHGLFQGLANMFAANLRWSATADEIRAWLRRIAKRDQGPVLVIAIDGLSATHSRTKQDVEELVAGSLGPKLKLVIAIDDGHSEAFLRHDTGRQATKLGRIAQRFELKVLDDGEFGVTANLLWKMRIGFMDGAQLSQEYRIPWLLRAIVGEVVSERKERKESIAVVPSLMGLHLIDETRARFNDDHELLPIFRRFGECVLEELHSSKPVGLTLESIMAFVISEKAAQTKFGYAPLNDVLRRGLAKRVRHQSGEDILVPRVPELLAAEISMLLGKELARRIKANEAEAALWLVTTTERLPLGDLIGAQAILDAATLGSVLPWNFFAALLSKPPKREKVRAGLRAAMNWPGVGTLEVAFNEDGSLTATSLGRLPHRIETETQDREEMELYGDMGAWLILSHLAAMHLVVLREKNDIVGSATPAILMEVASSKIPLRRPASEGLEQGYFTHDLGEAGVTVCHKSGIVEPITLSLLNAIHAGLIDEEWLRDAVSRNSFPLLSRLDIAFNALAHLDDEKSEWAHHMQDSLIAPALKRFIKAH